MQKEQVMEQLKQLVQTFRDNIKQYHLPEYKEARVRKEFIDKLFTFLSWDVDNTQGLAEQYKEVINEDAIKIGGKTKAPDYAFRIGGTRVFFVEAKKPSVNLKDDSDAAFQLRRYAYNSKIPISILTDFEEFFVYDCRFRPHPKDGPAVGRILQISFSDYVSKFDTIWSIFSKEAVLKGSFDRYVESSKGKKGTSEVDAELLKEIETWRDELARNIALRNPQLSVTELNYCVQKTIERILFLRICEDRNIEPEDKLKTLSEQEKVYDKLLEYFKYADQKYNSGIFDFRKDLLTPEIIIDDKVLKEIVSDLYYPKSPYDFSVLPIEILGSVYERFLGKTIRLTSGHRAVVEEKPEVRKAGGVYYTPEFVVDYIVKNTVGKLVEGKTPKDIEKIRVLDPASGSGTFLVRAYTYLLNYHLQYYLQNPVKYKKEIYQIRENVWYLTTEVRKNILLNNIFGVDIDPQAVEFTKLSLLLKVLENETMESVNQQRKLLQERALPNLDANIKCGNSVVDSSYFEQSTLKATSPEELAKINPFDWGDKEKGFGKILAEGGFDCIIGNPPYVKEDVNREIFEYVKKTNLKKYYMGKMDFWYFFTCHAIDLLKENGLHSFIAQNNWITSAGAAILRKKILTESRLLSFFDFNEYRVFKEASIQTMVFVLQKEEIKSPYTVNYYKINNKNLSKEEIRNYLLTERDGIGIVHYKAKISLAELVNKTITFADTETGTILNKIAAKSNFQLQDEDIGNGIDVLQDFLSTKHLDVLKDETLKKGSGIFVLTKDELKQLHLNKHELDKIKPYYTAEELRKYYGNSENKYWIIYADKDVRENIKDYPNIKAHLDRFKRILTSAFKPYGLHRPREQHFFEGEKIFSLRKTKGVSFTFTDFPCYVSRAFLIIKPKQISLKYLAGLLNSSLLNFWLYHKGKKQGEQLQVDKAPLLEIPLYKPNENNKEELKIEKEIIHAVETIIDVSRKLSTVKLDSEKIVLEKQIQAFENKIDELVYKLYEINAEEQEAIKTSTE